MRYKTYKKHLTKRRKQMRKEIILILAVMIGAGIIGNAGQIEAYKIVPEQTKNENGIICHSEPENAPTATVASVEWQIRAIASQQNFKWPDYLIKLAYCESRFDPFAIGDNGKSRGLFQIHRDYHPEITNQQAFDIEFATNWTMNMINAGKQNQWACNNIVLTRK